MKISFVVGKLVNRSGGAERVLRDIADGLVSKGHHVTVYSYNPDLEGDGFYPFKNEVRHINLGLTSPRLIQSFKSKLGSNISPKGDRFPGACMRDIAFIWRKAHFLDALVEQLAGQKPDIIVGFMGDGICVAAAALERLKWDVPFLASLHASPVRLFAKTGAKERLTQKAFTLASGVGFPLFEHCAHLNDEVKSKFETYPNPVHFPKFKPTWRRNNRILAVGRLVPLKRLDILVDAWGRISQSYPNWTLEFFGSGPELNYLQNRSRSCANAERIIFHGDVSEIEKEYRTASILVHPSKYEGFGLVLAEALGHGVPVVGYANVPGVQSLVKDGHNGVLVAPNGDIDALSHCLQNLLSNPKKRHSYSEAAWASVQEYSFDQAIDTWDRQLTQLVLRK